MDITHIALTGTDGTVYNFELTSTGAPTPVVVAEPTAETPAEATPAQPADQGTNATPTE